MPTIRLKSLAQFKRRIVRDLELKERKLGRATRRAARKGVRIVRRNAPVAFSDLRDSIHARDSSIVADAPHAAAIEHGSRPHMPPVAPIIKWVKLRGAQGLVGGSSRGRLPGSTSRDAAEGVATMLAGMERKGASPVSAPERVAWAIAMSIKKRGTKPHHFMAKSVPEVAEILDREVKRVMRSER